MIIEEYEFKNFDEDNYSKLLEKIESLSIEISKLEDKLEKQTKKYLDIKNINYSDNLENEECKKYYKKLKKRFDKQTSLNLTNYLLNDIKIKGIKITLNENDYKFIKRYFKVKKTKFIIDNNLENGEIIIKAKLNIKNYLKGIS